jgi:hypothetical protein
VPRPVLPNAKFNRTYLNSGAVLLNVLLRNPNTSDVHQIRKANLERGNAQLPRELSAVVTDLVQAMRATRQLHIP